MTASYCLFLPEESLSSPAGNTNKSIQVDFPVDNEMYMLINWVDFQIVRFSVFQRQDCCWGWRDIELQELFTSEKWEIPAFQTQFWELDFVVSE